MGKIKVLDEALINKIAAGEVIERPASVVKEFIENSIDAKAKKISIILREGGISYIKIMDDGSGMDGEDAKLCWERHATSKIADANDLFSIKTLGFRGEALASVAAVSKMTITTRQTNNTEGTKIEIEGGKLISDDSIGCPVGTIIEVNDLFYNTPARKKYLKAFSTELTHIIDIVTRYALINPEIHFSVEHNDKQIFSSPSSDMKNNLVNIFGLTTTKDMIEIDYEDEGISIKGFVSKPTVTRSDKNNQSIFVNSRYVKNKIISDAVYDAYHTLLTVKRHPVVVLDINIDHKIVDVNVHPTKIEIRLQSEDKIRKAVFDAVRKSLVNTGLIVDLTQESLNEEKIFPAQKQVRLNQQEMPIRTNKPIIQQPTSNIRRYPVIKEKQQMLDKGNLVASESKSDYVKEQKLDLPKFNVLGQVHKTYIIAEVQSGFYIIDQHVAHERILYEKFMSESRLGKIGTQQLINPVQLSLSAKEALVLTDNLDVFTNLGFEIEDFGNHSFILRSVPVILGKLLDQDDMMDIADELLKNLQEDKNRLDNVENKRESLIVTMACRAAIKAGKELTSNEVNVLINDLMKTENPFTCPHGRPVIINMSLNELEKLFKRVQ